MKPLAAVSLLVLTAGCGASPTAPSGPTLAIRIGPNATDLKVGDIETARVVLRDAAGAETQVSAAILVDNDAILRLDPEGRLVAIAPGTTVLRASFDGMSAVEQVQVFTNFEGEWTGTYLVEDCLRISGPGSSYCRGTPGRYGRFHIWVHIAQRGGTLTGEVTLGTGVLRGEEGLPAERGNLSGEASSSGVAHLHAHTTSVIDDYTGTSELSASAVEIMDGLLTGTFTRQRTFINFFGPQVSREECRLEGLTRS